MPRYTQLHGLAGVLRFANGKILVAQEPVYNIPSEIESQLSSVVYDSAERVLFGDGTQIVVVVDNPPDYSEHTPGEPASVAFFSVEP